MDKGVYHRYQENMDARSFVENDAGTRSYQVFSGLVNPEDTCFICP